MTWATYSVIAVAHWIVCLAIAWLCICRLNLDSCRRRLCQRARYTLLLAGACASGLSPALFGEWPGPGTLMLSSGLLAALVLNLPHFHNIYREGD